MELNLNSSPLSAFTCSVALAETGSCCGPHFHPLHNSDSNVGRQGKASWTKELDHNILALCEDFKACRPVRCFCIVMLAW